MDIGELQELNQLLLSIQGEIVHGIVKSGGKRKLVMVLDGGERILSGNPLLFKSLDKPLPQDEPNLMDKWGVKGYKSFDTSDGYAFYAFITLNGKRVIEVTNYGQGGPNLYEGDNKFIKRLEKDAQEWVKLFSTEEHIEIEDTWVEWYVERRPYGVTAKAYFEQWDAEWQKMKRN